MKSSLDPGSLEPRRISAIVKSLYTQFFKRGRIGKKIFIDRTDSTSKHCQIQNESEVFNYLKNKGFSKYQLTK